MIALYPGAFKPPHRGHFEVVKSLLNGNHNGVEYSIDNYSDAGMQALKGSERNVEPINKVVIFISGGVRNGISLEESMKVWNIYSKYLGNIEIVDGGSNPMITAKDYAKANQDQKFYAITGIRSEEDLVDLKRVTTFKNRKNVEGLVIPASPNANVRATDFRKALLSGNLDQVTDFFPKEVSREDILKIMKMLKSSIIAEEMENQLNNKLDNLFETKEGSSGTHVAHKSVQRSEDRANLVTLYNKLRHDLGDDLFHIDFNQDNIKITNKGEDFRINFDYTPYMGSLLEYMIDQGVNILPLPEIKIKKDIKESSNFFGRTAYYNPELKEIVLFVEGRHPKDVMRSFVHELIHHKQNLEGRLGYITTTNTNESEQLLELEKEAYLEANITFRNWEDSVKS